MSTSPVNRPFLVGRNSSHADRRLGLHLVPPVRSKRHPAFDHTHSYYKIAAVGAALFLMFTTC